MVESIERNVEDAILGNKMKMDALLSSLRTNAYNAEHFHHVLITLRKFTPSFAKEHEVLIGVVLSTDWGSYNDDCANSFLEFVADLILCQAHYLKICVRSLIRTFLVKSEFSHEDLVKFQRKCNYAHTCINTIVKMAPLSVKFIKEAIIHLFPYIGKSIFTLETYIVNILQVVTYVQGCQPQILALIIDKMLTIDVGISREEMERTEKDQLQFDVEDVNINRLGNLQEVEKLDQLMTILLTYTRSLCFVDGVLKFDRAESLFNDLSQIYEGVILKTQQSSHVQFVLFYVSSFHKVRFLLCKLDVVFELPDLKGEYTM